MHSGNIARVVKFWLGSFLLRIVTFVLLVALMVVWGDKLLGGQAKTLRVQYKLGSLLARSELPEARLVGLPLPPIDNSRDEHELRRLFKTLSAKLKYVRSPQKLRDIAVIRMLSHNWGEAVTLLEEAVAKDARDASIYSDLAVAYFGRGGDEGRPYDFVLALASAERALSLDPALEEALFNRALIMSRLWILRGAEAAWTDYIQRYPGSEWLPLAYEHKREIQDFTRELSEKSQRILLQSLTDRALPEGSGTLEGMVAADPQAVRIYIEDELLATWADSAGSKFTPQRHLELGRELGDILFLRTGDRLIKDSIEVIERSGLPTLERLVRGHLEYGKGRVLSRERKIAEARASFRNALELLSSGGSPFRLWASFQLAACSYFDKDYLSALRELEWLQRELQYQFYPNLKGRVEWLIGLIRLEGANPGLALVHFERALGQFQRTGELGNQASVLSLMAHVYELLGDIREAWRLRYQALGGALKAQDSIRLPVIFGEAVRAATREGEFSVALLLQSEVIESELRTNDPLAISEALWRRGRIHQRAGNSKKSLADIRIAKEYCNRLAHKVTRLQTTAGILATEGAALKESDPRAAIRVLSQALELYRLKDFKYQNGEILLERARARRKLGQLESARRDLEEGLLIYEEHIKSVRDNSLQISYWSQADQLLEELTVLYLQDEGDAVSAFRTVERGRARWLFQQLTEAHSGGGVWGGVATDKVLHNLPSNTIFVEYSIMDGESLVWVISSRGVQCRPLSFGESWLRRYIDVYTDAVLRGDPEIDELSGILYGRVIEPIAPFLRGYEAVVFIPDKSLHRIPFAALRNRKSGRFMIEDHRISLAPSIATYLIMLSRDSFPVQWNNIGVLAVGNPAFSRTNFPGYSSLHGAEEEVADLAKIYRNSSTFIGDNATAEVFLREFGRYGIVHFSGHAQVSIASPDSSQLLFAPSEQRAGGLTVGEIRNLKLSAPRLLFLSSCSTSSGRHFYREGPESIAQPFLAAGVPRVVATLWRIDDEVTRKFTSKFYSALKRGLSPSEALQVSQIALLKDQDARLNRASSWAAFQLIGLEN